MFGLVFNPWFWEQKIIPLAYRNRFRVNADIVPATAEERAQFVSINPNFRVQFGDKEEPASAFLRFAAVEGEKKAQLNNDISLNPLENSQEVIAALQDKKIAGVELTLFSASVDGLSMLDNNSDFEEDEELVRIARELLGEEMEEGSFSGEIEEVEAKKEEIVTETIADRENDQDIVKNMAVAPDVDIKYLIEAGRGIKSQIIVGDRAHFDTACLSALSQGVSELCDVPRNRFSFLLSLDPGLSLEKSKVSIDGGTRGSYYVKDSNGNFLMRLANPQVKDKDNQVITDLDFTLEPASVGGEEAPGYYILTFSVGLDWLTSSKRQYPVTIESGFFVDHGDLFLPAMVE